jgi:hypothetical protein
MQLEVKKHESDTRDLFPEVIRLMNSNFRNLEQFEQSLDRICLDIAFILGGFYSRQGEILKFDFVRF